MPPSPLNGRSSITWRSWSSVAFPRPGGGLWAGSLRGLAGRVEPVGRPLRGTKPGRARWAAPAGGTKRRATAPRGLYSGLRTQTHGVSCHPRARGRPPTWPGRGGAAHLARAAEPAMRRGGTTVGAGCRARHPQPVRQLRRTGYVHPTTMGLPGQAPVTCAASEAHRLRMVTRAAAPGPTPSQATPRDTKRRETAPRAPFSGLRTRSHGVSCHRGARPPHARATSPHHWSTQWWPILTRRRARGSDRLGLDPWARPGPGTRMESYER